MAGHKFRRQHPFGPYILDFYCANPRIAVELDGGQHFESARMVEDAERSSYLEENGVLILRFTDLEILLDTGRVLEAIWAAVSPSPYPLPTGERDRSIPRNS